MKKIFEIKITSCAGRPEIWYANKIGRVFEAELKIRPGTHENVYYITMSQHVYPDHCEVISERTIKLYE